MIFEIVGFEENHKPTTKPRWSCYHSKCASYCDDEPRGTSGTAVDSVADTTIYGQASSIYFTPLANGVAGSGTRDELGCAVKATQNGWH